MRSPKSVLKVSMSMNVRRDRCEQYHVVAAVLAKSRMTMPGCQLLRRHWDGVDGEGACAWEVKRERWERAVR